MEEEEEEVLADEEELQDEELLDEDEVVSDVDAEDIEAQQDLNPDPVRGNPTAEYKQRCTWHISRT